MGLGVIRGGNWENAANLLKPELTGKRHVGIWAGPTVKYLGAYT